MKKKLFGVGIVFCNVFILLIVYVVVSFDSYILVVDKKDDCYRIEEKPVLLRPKGIAVDSEGNIYIGDSDILHHSSILVFNSEFEYQYSIDTFNYGSIAFDLDDKDHLNVAYVRGDHVIVFDKEGCIVEKVQDSNSEIFNKYDNNEKKYTTEDGIEYQIKNILGYVRVIKIEDHQERVVYKIPRNQFLINVSQMVIFISFSTGIGALSFHTFLKNEQIMIDKRDKGKTEKK